MLQVLYDEYYENPVNLGIDRKKMLELLQIPEKVMDANMLYLENKGLVRLHKTIGSPWTHAKITAFGIDVIENKEKYKEKFPFVQIQEIYGDVYGNVIQAKDSQIIKQIDSVFRRARDLTRIKKDIPLDLRKKTEEKLTFLEKELKKEEPDIGKVHGLWNWLKNNASWVIPIIKDVVVESLEAIFCS